MKDTKRMLTAAVIAALLFLFLFLGMHWNLLVAVLLSVGVYIGFLILLKPDPENGKMYVESMPGGEELEKLLKDARKDLVAMEESIGAIRDSHVQRDACMLHGTGKRILAYLEENPDKINLARRFFTYYLDMAASLLERYVDFQDTGLHSGEVAEILQKTGEALPVLNDAFEKQFTNLMRGELLDTEVDIELLKNTLKMEEGMK